MTIRVPALAIAIAALLFASCNHNPGSVEAADHHDHGEAKAAAVERAVAVMSPVAESGVRGIVYFVQEGDKVRIVGEITGLEPGLHGFHVHQWGDLTSPEDGLAAGGHYDPEGKPHGAPGDDHRHVGDLGNVEADENGVARFERVDDVIQLNGAHSIVGRGLVVHAKEDVFTQPVGDAGPRVGLGVIGIADPGRDMVIGK